MKDIVYPTRAGIPGVEKNAEKMINDMRVKKKNVREDIAKFGLFNFLNGYK